MSVTRKNHYVPQWHQERFFALGKATHCLLDLNPPTFRRRDGTTALGRHLFDSPSSRAFVEDDLYSTFFGAELNDEIERIFFGDIDRRGAQAVRAFCHDDKGAWHEHFQDLFEFLDIQKLRTPKGLAWLRQHYPEIGRLGEMLPGVAQNQLMFEMQGIRMLNVQPGLLEFERSSRRSGRASSSSSVTIRSRYTTMPYRRPTRATDTPATQLPR
jgi:hypothetical protein